MNSVVTQRFIKCIHALKEHQKIKSARQFAISLDYLPQGLSEMMNGRRDVTIELLRKAVEMYSLNSAYLLTGSGSLFADGSDQDDFQVLTIVTDAENNERIVHVPVAAQAGYAEQFHDPVFIEELPTYSLPDPNFQVGSYRSFDVEGSSMEPTLHHGDKVVCAFIEPQYWQDAIKDGDVYVVVTQEGVVVKRLLNRIRTTASVELISDNAAFVPSSLAQEELREIWRVRLKISPFLDKPSSADITQDLEDQMSRQSALIDRLNKTLESLGR